MKKNKIIACLVAISVATGGLLTAILSNSEQEIFSDDMFDANVEALSRTEEGGIYGTCTETVNDCMGPCPGCGQLIYAPGHRGEPTFFGTCNH